jgi:hypothetical protein
MVCTPATPVNCSAIVGAAPPWPFHVPLNRRLAVDTQSFPTGSRHNVPLPVFVPPGLLVAPCQTLGRLATPAPRPEVLAPRFVPRLARLVTTDRGDVGAPASDHRVQRRDETGRGVHPRSAHHGPYLALMTCPRLPARFDDGFVSARGRRGGWPHVETQAVKPCVTPRDRQGMGEAGLARFHGQ